MKKKQLVLILTIALLIIVIGGLAFYFLRPDATYINGGADTNNTQLTDEQVQEVLAELGDNILLPKEDDPYVAVITDINALVAEQPFYAGAENGDYLIIYPQTARAIIYSLKRDQIINVGPVEFDQTQQQAETIETQSQAEVQENFFSEPDVTEETTLDTEVEEE